jgi:phosphinothricin acetyltransferase
MIRPVAIADLEMIARIYNHYILNTLITFEEKVVTTREMEESVRRVSLAGLPWLVAEESNRVVGYAYAGEWKGRCAYRYSVESSVYLDPNATGRGLGSKLYEALFAILREKSIHTVIGGIALPNPRSIALHEKFGMQKVAHFKEVGFKFNRWVDVGYWQVGLGAGKLERALSQVRAAD